MNNTTSLNTNLNLISKNIHDIIRMEIYQLDLGKKKLLFYHNVYVANKLENFESFENKNLWIESLKKKKSMIFRSIWQEGFIKLKQLNQEVNFISLCQRIIILANEKVKFDHQKDFKVFLVKIEKIRDRLLTFKQLQLNNSYIYHLSFKGIVSDYKNILVDTINHNILPKL